MRVNRLFLALLVFISASCAAAEEPDKTVVNDPNAQSEMAVETLQYFMQQGEDISEARHTIHYFYDGNHVGLLEALKARGYTVRPTVGDDGVVAERMDVTDEKWRVETLKALSELANAYGSEYDGWEAAMTRQGRN